MVLIINTPPLSFFIVKKIIILLAIIPIFGSGVFAECKPIGVDCFDTIGEGYVLHTSPKVQMENGVPAKNVMCFEGRDLMFKPNSETPICVFPESAPKLIQRGFIDVIDQA